MTTATLADYQGRTADLLAFHGDFSAYTDVQTSQTLALPSTGGALVTGVQKLAQRFLLILLTRRGSRIYAPDEGTDFMSDSLAGAWRTVTDVSISFASARLDAVRQMKAVETVDDPPDEQLDNVVLRDIGFGTDRLVLRIQLVTKAGNSYVFVPEIHVRTR